MINASNVNKSFGPKTMLLPLTARFRTAMTSWAPPKSRVSIIPSAGVVS